MNAEVKKGFDKKAMGTKTLGRGLASLLGDEGQDYAQLDKARSTKNVPIEMIAPGKFQPRQDFDKEAIEALAASIREKGVLQPLLVRRDPIAPNQYELIAGERRWRASQIAKLHEVPVIIKELSDREALEIGLIENLQRQDLNPVEEALAYYRLMNEFDNTQESVAKALGKSRSYIANMVRLLDLPQSVRQYLRDGKLTVGHTRALIGVKNAEELATQMVDKNLNVRQAEALVSGVKNDTDVTPARVMSLQTRAGFTPAANNNAGRADQPGNNGPDADTRALEKQLSQVLGMKVDIKFQGKTGSLTIHYQSLDQLDDVLKRLNK